MHTPLVKAQTKTQDKGNKRKGDSSNNRGPVSHGKKKLLKPHMNPKLNNVGDLEVDMEVDASEDNQPKKRKTATGYMAMLLRRTG